MYRLRVFDLSPDVLEARGLGNANESSLDAIAAELDSATPPITIQACTQDRSACVTHVCFHLEPYIAMSMALHNI